MEDWQRVAEALQAEIDRQGLSYGMIRRSHGVSYETVVKALRGEPIKRRDRRAALSLAMSWPADGIDRIAAGTADAAALREEELATVNRAADAFRSVGFEAEVPTERGLSVPDLEINYDPDDEQRYERLLAVVPKLLGAQLKTEIERRVRAEVEVVLLREELERLKARLRAESAGR